jgi:hypothetical protein
MHRDQALGRSRRLEALHLAFSLPHRLMGGLGPIVLVNSLFMLGTQEPISWNAAPYKRSLSVVTQVGAKPCLLSSLRMSFRAAALFRRLWIRTFSTSPSSSIARHSTSACQ